MYAASMQCNAVQWMRMTTDKRFTIKNRIKDIQRCDFIVDTTSQHHNNQLFHIL